MYTIYLYVYSVGQESNHNLLLYLSTVTPVIEEIRLASKFHDGSHVYTLHYKVDVYNYNTVDATSAFQTDPESAGNFELSMAVHDVAVANPIDVTQTEADHPKYHVVIPQDGSVRLEGTGWWQLLYISKILNNVAFRVPVLTIVLL